MSITSTAPEGYANFDADLRTPSDSRFETEREERTLEAYEEQEQFLDYGPTYHAIITGIGAGKTTALIQRIGLNVEYWNPGETGVVIAPTVPSLRNVIIPELRKWGFLEIGEWKPSQNTWRHPNGAKVIFESADNDRKIDRLRGPNIAWFGMDEPSTISKLAWDIMVGRLRDGEYINAFVSGTPKGKNWLHDLFVNPETRLDDVNAITGIPTHVNPYLPDIYTDEIIEQYEGGFYEQEVLGKFVQFEGLVYPWFSSEDHVIPELPEQYDEVIYGVDWGHNNPAVILTLVRQGDRWIVAEEFYETRCTVDDIVSRLKGMQERWVPSRVYCDPAEPASIEHLSRAGISAHKADNDVMPGIQHVSSLRDELRVHESCQNVRNEFSQYQYKDGGDSDDVLKENDHAMDALRYALFSHQTPDGQTGTGTWGSSWSTGGL